MTHLPGSRGERILQDRFGTSARAAAFYGHQMLDHLNATMLEYIARQSMMFVATADARGECDCTFRGGPAGFVRALDARRVVYPEYRGNGVMASLGNIVENGHVGLLFIDFETSSVGLHVNGRASIVENDTLLAMPDLPDEVRADIVVQGGRAPERWVLVEVIEAYIHCSKHIPSMQKVEKDIDWGTDDVVKKGGDAFRAKSSPAPWKSANSAQPRSPFVETSTDDQGESLASS